MESSEIIIRRAEPGDVAGLALFSTESFYHTYAAYNTAADMRAYTNEYFSIEKLTGEITAADNDYYLALYKEDIAGYFKLRNLHHPDTIAHLHPVELERIYVSNKMKQKGIGTLLINHAVNIARKKGCKVLWLGVWEKNENAIRFYEKQGFTKFGQHAFVLGNDVQNDWLYQLEIG